MTPRHLTCREVVELASEHFDATLPPDLRERFTAHVAGCRDCQTYLRQLRITVDAVHAAGAAEPVDAGALLAAFRRQRASGGAGDGLD